MTIDKLRAHYLLTELDRAFSQVRLGVAPTVI